MSIDRKQSRVIIGTNRVRYSARVLGEECAKGTHEAMQHQQIFLQLLVDNPHLLFCGPSRFETMRVLHNGTRWEAQAEAVVSEDTEG